MILDASAVDGTESNNHVVGMLVIIVFIYPGRKNVFILLVNIRFILPTMHLIYRHWPPEIQGSTGRKRKLPANHQCAFCQRT